jgi:hypothetical protein
MYDEHALQMSYIRELKQELQEALDKGAWLKGDDTIESFIEDADRPLIDSGVAYAWGRLLGAAEMVDMTVIELLDEAEES